MAKTSRIKTEHGASVSEAFDNLTNGEEQNIDTSPKIDDAPHPESELLPPPQTFVTPEHDITIELTEWEDEHWYRVFDIATGEEIGFLPSVTTKLSIIDKPFLRRWYADLGWKEATARMHDAQERGSRVHHAIETLNNGGVVVYNKPAWKGAPKFTEAQIQEIADDHDQRIAVLQNQREQIQVDRYDQFLSITNAKLVYAEQKLFSLGLQAAGTSDIALNIPAGSYMIAGSKPVKLPAGIYICDIKTGSVGHDEHQFQIGAYAYMFEEMTGIRAVGGLILYTDVPTIKNGIPEFKAEHFNRGELDEGLHGYRMAAALWDWKNKDRGPKIKQFRNIISRNKQYQEAQ